MGGLNWVIKMFGFIVFFIYINLIKGLFEWIVTGKYRYYSVRKIIKDEEIPLGWLGFIVLMLIFVSTYFV